MPAASTTPAGEVGARPAGPGFDGLLLAAAWLASLALIWLVAHQPLVVAGFAGGSLALIGAARVIMASRTAAPVAELAEPDWSVTVAAIDRGDDAVSITDRAGRLVCANRRFESWFGDAAPPTLALAPGMAQRLADAARDAWREGLGLADVGGIGGGERETGAGCPARFRAEAVRAGRGEDYLVWRFSPVTAADPIAELGVHLAGAAGAALARAGFAAAVVEPTGAIRFATTGLAERARGDPQAAMAGQPFNDLLIQDDSQRLFWERDQHRQSPVTLYRLPLAESGTPGEDDPARTPSLMLIADTGAGLGGDGSAPAAAPHLEALLGQLPLGLAMAERDGRILFANAAFMRAAGREGQAPPSYPTDFFVQEDKAAVSDAVRRFGQGSASTSGDLAVRLAAQPDEPVSLSLAGVRGLGEAAVLLSLADTSEETRLKRQVAQATKMQAIGQLAGGVAHDFNNVLTAIIGTCDLMLLRHMPGDSDYDDIQQIRANSNRAASLTRQLLAFSRQQTLRPQVLQLPDVVSDVTQMLQRLIGEKIQLVVSHDRDLGPVRADPTQLEQVIVNLTVNARDAIQDATRRKGGDGSGQVRITTRRVEAAHVRAMRSEILPVGDYSALVVEDTGSGIAGEDLTKIWVPFYTTKEQGKGTGLGLSTVYGIVKQSGGFIFADNVPGGGARFTVYLPVHQSTPGEAPASLSKPREEAMHWAGGGEVLLVEDEDSVRMVADRALTRAGYTVTTASDGEEGLERIRERLSGGVRMFDLVLSDVVMPGLDGPAMVRAIRASVPDIPVIFMSGHAEEQLRREIDVENAQFIPKPFSVQQIGDKVADVLSSKS